MKYYIIAGEASGDLHGSNLIRALKKTDPEADFRFWGGDQMQMAGGTLVKHYRELAFMGFAEVLLNLPEILRNISFCKKDIEQYDPDVIVFVDYPGFNLRIARWAKKKGFRTHFYVSPQIWAWKENRIRDIKRDIDRMYVILPFEKDFYEKKHDYQVDFVGHPLIDAIAQRPVVDKEGFKLENGLDGRPVIALLPGSRRQEITKILGVMMQICGDFNQYQFIVAGAPGIEKEFYQDLMVSRNVRLVMNRTYDLLSLSTAAIVTSGTATLETALFKVPEVVCYKGSWLSYMIAKKVIRLKYISLVNLIMEREVVKELIQEEFNRENLKKELERILMPEIRERIFLDYFELENKLGGPGASNKTAELIYTKVEKEKK